MPSKGCANRPMRPPDALEPDQLRIRNSRTEQRSLFVGRECLAWTFPILYLARYVASLRCHHCRSSFDSAPQQIPENGHLALEPYFTLAAVKSCNAGVNSL